LLPRIWRVRNSLAACDASYVAFAEAVDAPLITCDAKLGAVARSSSQNRTYLLSGLDRRSREHGHVEISVLRKRTSPAAGWTLCSLTHVQPDNDTPPYNTPTNNRRGRRRSGSGVDRDRPSVGATRSTKKFSSD
jgi:hypothetical protein